MEDKGTSTAPLVCTCGNRKDFKLTGVSERIIEQRKDNTLYVIKDSFSNGEWRCSLCGEKIET
jgi:hypothetical protein